jgi:undecaprenyl-diphosphatase
MTTIQAAWFGLVEGLTEFIPVSSTGHLLVTQHLLGVQVADSVFAFLVLIQMGPLAALLVFFRNDLWWLIRAFFARPFSTPSNRLAWFILIATVPALLVGALLKDVVQALFGNPLLEAAIRFFAAALLLLLAEGLGRRTRGLNEMSWLDALTVGLFQVFAVFPGASRSGAAISGGMLRNFERGAATRFAFLMSAPIMLAAGGYESLAVLRVHVLQPLLPALAIGLLISAITGWISIRWLIGYVSRHSLFVFSAYCALAAIVSLVLLRS